MRPSHERMSISWLSSGYATWLPGRRNPPATLRRTSSGATSAPEAALHGPRRPRNGRPAGRCPGSAGEGAWAARGGRRGSASGAGQCPGGVGSVPGAGRCPARANGREESGRYPARANGREESGRCPARANGREESGAGEASRRRRCLRSRTRLGSAPRGGPGGTGRVRTRTEVAGAGGCGIRRRPRRPRSAGFGTPPEP